MKPLERNPVLLGQEILLAMKIAEDQHDKIAPLFLPFWSALIALRDALPEKLWTRDLLAIIVDPPKVLPKHLNCKEWRELDLILNTIYTEATS